MSYESGLGSNSAPYEYSVCVKNKSLKIKKISFIIAYAMYIILVFVIGAIAKIIVPLLAFVPLSTWVIVWLTWKYTQLSYEYSFFKGEITVSRVYGTDKKSILAKVKIKDLTEMYCFKEAENVSDVSSDQSIFAARSEHEERLTAVVWTNEKNERVALFFEADQKALKIIHYYNSSIV